ncbi:syntaxin-11-like [Denticeps clupeoides]|uniref:syntaxin-11-like n=1 Tax=Denticeps clupeoides TaxID=299321 RepID=UPI0010A30252|nr:syntaxin-11-like [Denticeps clupeoides]
MRDRLGHLQALSSEADDELDLPTPGGASSDVEVVLSSAQDAHREIQLLRLEVGRLRERNSRVLGDPSSPGDAISSDVKTRGERMLGQLRDMDVRVRELEQERGGDSAVARIARTQYACLSNNFRDAMMDYNEAEMSHRDTCKAHIQRQLEIVGQEVTGEEMEEMMEAGRWNVFTENILSEGKTARSALSQIESRHQDLLDLESRIKSVREVFLDVAMLVEEQGPMINTIQANVQKAEVASSEALGKMNAAKKHDRNHPFKKLFFWKR